MKFLRGWLLVLPGLFAMACSADTEVDLARAEAYALDGDFAPAWCIWKPLADEGNVTAQFNLGWLYHNGNGVAANDERARQLWEQAARSGHAEAQMALAMLYGQRGSAVEELHVPGIAGISRCPDCRVANFQAGLPAQDQQQQQ